MKISQKRCDANGDWTLLSTSDQPDATLVFAFGERKKISDPSLYPQLQSWYPQAHIICCSTAGEILGTRVEDDTIAVTALLFEKTQIYCASVNIAHADQSEQVGEELSQALKPKGLTHVLLFSEGLTINGTALVRGLSRHLPTDVAVTGGLVGDGTRFEKTVLGLDAIPEAGKIIAVGLYGSALKVGYGSLGGWDFFGPNRMITKSKGNVLYELDHKPALALYKEYLGEQAKALPSAGLLFPLTLQLQDSKGEPITVVRTILSVDESSQSLSFAGDMPTGVYTRMMRANFDRLVDGAAGAASMSKEGLGSSLPDLALLISCIGRKLVLKGRIEEEVEAVQSVIGKQAVLTGFYSYGELCPVTATAHQCQLHNQTMTITTLREEV